MKSSITSCCLFLAAAIMFFPSELFCEGSEEYARAEMLVQQTLRKLTPPADAAFGFTKTTRRLAHLKKPWQTWQSNASGTFLLADDVSSFYQVDSVKSGQAVYSSFKYCCDTTLAIINYGESEPEKITLSEKQDFVYDVSSLTPVFLLKDFLAQASEQSFLRYVAGPIDSVVYKGNSGNIVSFAIDPDDRELRSVSITYNDPLYGDVLNTVTFDDYKLSKKGGFRYPAKITEHMLGFDASVVTVSLSDQSFDKARILGMIPPTYRIDDNPPPPSEEIIRTDYNDHIHLLDLKHVNTRVMVVEFKDYLLVAGTPLNTRNGELVIEQAQKIAPEKPIRYFVFGHHHPHYIGGIRAFVHAGATVISMSPDSAYVEQLVSFKHSLDPDILELEPRPLKLETFTGEKIISDGEIELRLINIDTLSHHTENFLVYYFPKEKLLFEDELAWIPVDKALTPANGRQKGLYDAIQRYKMDVNTILQSWPLNRGTKVMFDFEELKRSVEMIPPTQ